MSSKYMRALLILTIITSFISNFAIAQPKDWKDVSREALEMEVYPSDSSAAAVVLFDKAVVELNHNLEYVMNRHVRLKILNEEGYKWAKAELTYNDEFDQDIGRVRGYTYNLTDNGKVKRHKLRRRSVYQEEIDEDYKRIKFTMPALQPGSVVEFKYKKDIISPHLLPDWQFQRSIPVAWSEYNVQIPEWFFYNKMFVGSHPLYKNETERFREVVRFKVKRRSGAYVSRTDFGNVSVDMVGEYKKWAMKDLPAVERLPYMTSIDDYKAKLWIQLTEIRFPREPVKHFLKSWDDVAKEIRETDSFGNQLKSRSEFTSVVEGLTEGLSDPKAKMGSIFKFIVESMVWDGSYTFLTENDIDEALRLKKGNSAELNLLLVQFLREAGLNANPVLLSTRDHGKVLEYFAMVDQFNHVITRVEVDGKIYLLDATSDDVSVNILPIQDLNNKGLMVTDKKADWVKLNPSVPTQSKVSLTGKITTDGAINGVLYVSSQGYHASKEGLQIKEDVQKKLVENLLNDRFQAGDTLDLTDDKLNGNSLKYQLSLSDYKIDESQRSDDRFYFNPMIFLQEENPFSRSERNIPINFPFKFEKEFVANLKIPDGYTIEEVPKPKSFTIPGKGVELKRLVQVTQNRIMVLSQLSINKTTFKAGEYKILKNFFQQVTDIQNEQVVLKKTATVTESGK